VALVVWGKGCKVGGGGADLVKLAVDGLLRGRREKKKGGRIMRLFRGLDLLQGGCNLQGKEGGESTRGNNELGGGNGGCRNSLKKEGGCGVRSSVWKSKSGMEKVERRGLINSRVWERLNWIKHLIKRRRGGEIHQWKKGLYGGESYFEKRCLGKKG